MVKLMENWNVGMLEKLNEGKLESWENGLNKKA
jgi:hypothetical protein